MIDEWRTGAKKRTSLSEFSISLSDINHSETRFRAYFRPQLKKRDEDIDEEDQDQ